MSWRGAAAAVVLLGVAGLTGGCAMHPLYATTAVGSSVAAELATVAIPEPKTRTEQLIRNDLLSAFRPVGTDAPDRYSLVITTQARLEKGIETRSSRVARRTVLLNIAFALNDIATAKTVYSGKTFSQVSYDRTGQSFADLQAESNAAERAAHEISQDIRTRIAAYFSSK